MSQSTLCYVHNKTKKKNEKQILHMKFVRNLFANYEKYFIKICIYAFHRRESNILGNFEWFNTSNNISNFSTAKKRAHYLPVLLKHYFLPTRTSPTSVGMVIPFVLIISLELKVMHSSNVLPLSLKRNIKLERFRYPVLRPFE